MKVLKYTTLFKVIVAIIATFGYFNHPHITRQIDTMGASLMYAFKFQNGFELFDLLPTSLAIGDRFREVTPMEFPILNIITSPLFLLKFKYNYAFAHIFLILLNSSLFLYGAYFLKKKKNNIWMLAWWLVPLYGVEMFYFTRFMPDGTAFLLTSLSFFMLWYKEKKILSIFLGALGLLIKPPLAIAYAPFVLKKPKEWPLLALSLIIIVTPPALYYTLGIDYLKSISTTSNFFAVSARNPLTSIITFFSHPSELFRLIFKDVFYRYSFIFILFAIYINKENNKLMMKLFGVFIIQLILAASLIAHHMYVHIYYIIGASFIVAWIMALTINAHPKLKYACLCFIAITNIERSIYTVKPLRKNNLKKQCFQILERFPELSKESKIRSTGSPSPRIGLCLQKITNSMNAKYGVYPKINDPRKQSFSIDRYLNLGLDIDEYLYYRRQEYYLCNLPIFETRDLKICSYLDEL